MGSYFSNFHVKKDSTFKNDLKAPLSEYLKEKGFVVTDDTSSDLVVSVYAPEDSDWMSVYCDAFDYEDVLALSSRVSQASGTDVLSIACFDSDYLFLNLHNAAEPCDLWLNIGKSYNIKTPRKNNLSEWRSRVRDFSLFKSAADQHYVCAEDFLSAVQDNLGISAEQAVGYGLQEYSYKLCFSAPRKENYTPTRLKIRHFGLKPCAPGQREGCFVINEGGASCGVRVMFVGDYIENDEITVSDTEFIYTDLHGDRVNMPITFEKRKLCDGSLAYCWEDKNFHIQEAVSPDLTPRAAADQESQRSFGIRYTPHGNKRKFLDICIVFMPLSNEKDGSCLWRVWAHHSSKRAFIEQENQMARMMTEELGAPLILLEPDEYDLD